MNIMALEALNTRIERMDEGDEPTYGKFVVEPLERGYGITLGNALRRVLLGSIPGAAITAVRIEGVLHEFSTIRGVVEDTTELLLNLKQVAVKVITDGEDLAGEEVRILRLERQGPGELTAADIEPPADLEIVNKDLHLATLDSSEAKVSMEMEVRTGKGYLASETQDRSEYAIGTIPLDAIFSPVRKVGFRVEPTRVAHITDLDRLILEVTTNGTIAPHDAISDAAKILDRYLLLFFDFPDQEKEAVAAEGIPGEAGPSLSLRIEDLDFSVRTNNCLRQAGIHTVGELIQRSEADLMGLRNFGRKSLQEVIDKLASIGLNLRQAGQAAQPLGEEGVPAAQEEDESEQAEPAESDEQ